MNNKQKHNAPHNTRNYTWKTQDGKNHGEDRALKNYVTGYKVQGWLTVGGLNAWIAHCPKYNSALPEDGLQPVLQNLNC